MAKTPTNLSVDPAVMERGKLYGQRHGTSVSQLVGDFLANLPSDDVGPEFSSLVTLLYGIAAPATHDLSTDRVDPVDAYHRHIDSKYGSRTKPK